MVDKNLNKHFNEKNDKPFVVDMLNLGKNDSKDLIKIDKKIETLTSQPRNQRKYRFTTAYPPITPI